MSNYEEALRYFATYAGLATVKMMVLGPLTSVFRIKDEVKILHIDTRQHYISMIVKRV